jgi:glycosyltransferase involved in cell wall biosynthesis
MKVSVIIPVYNVRPYLERCIQSVLCQTYKDLEIILVDDGSTDGSLSIAQDYQKNHPRGVDIRIISHDHNLGVSAARNRIIEEASGTYLYFMDADDLMEPNTIALLMEHQRRTGAEIVYGSYNKIETYNKNKVNSIVCYPLLELVGDGCLAEYAWHKYGNLQTTIWNYVVDVEMLRRSKVRFIDTDFWEDMAFTFDLLPYCQHAVLLPDITYHYMCHYDSLSKYQDRTQISKDEVLRNISTVDYMKLQCIKAKKKSYLPQRCLNVLRTDIYMMCYILKNAHKITPSFSRQELKTIMTHPATLSEIMDFPHERIKNLMFYLFSKLPARMVVWIMTVIGKSKGMI